MDFKKEQNVKLTYGSYWRCCHCGNFVGKTKKLYCEHCQTSKGRKEGCEENKKIFENAGLVPRFCKMCNI